MLLMLLLQCMAAPSPSSAQGRDQKGQQKDDGVGRTVEWADKSIHKPLGFLQWFLEHLAWNHFTQSVLWETVKGSKTECGPSLGSLSLYILLQVWVHVLAPHVEPQASPNSLGLELSLSLCF